MKCENCNNIVGLGYNNCPYCGMPMNHFISNNVDDNQPQNVQSNVANNEGPSVQPRFINVQPQNVQPNVMNNEASIEQPIFINNQPQPEQPNIMNNEALSEQPSVKNNNKSSKGIMAALCAVLVLIGLAVFYFVYLTNSRQVFVSSINKMTKPVLEVLDSKSYLTNFEFSTNIQTENGNSEFDEIADIFNGISIVGKTGIDFENKQFVIELNSLYDNEKLADLNLYFQDEKAYAYLKEAFDKYISVDFEEDYEKLFENSNTNVKIVIEEAKNAFVKSLKSDYFTKTKENGMTKHTLVLNEENIAGIAKSILSSLRKNEKFISNLVEISTLERQDIIDAIDENLESINSISEYDNSESIEISIYTSGVLGKFSKFEFDFESQGVKIYVVKNDKNNYTYTFEQDGEKVLSGKVYYSVDKPKTTMNISIDLDGIVLTLNYKYEFKTNVKLEKVNISNSIDYMELTENDINSITENLTKNKGLEKLIGKIEELDLNFGNTDNDDYELSTNEQKHTLKDLNDETELKVIIPAYSSVNFKSDYFVSYSHKNIDVAAKIDYFNSVDEYFQDFEDYDINDLKNQSFKNIVLSELKTYKLNNRTFYYKDLSFDNSIDKFYRKIYCIKITDNIVYVVEVESRNLNELNSTAKSALNFEIER